MFVQQSPVEPSAAPTARFHGRVQVSGSTAFARTLARWRNNCRWRCDRLTGRLDFDHSWRVMFWNRIPRHRIAAAIDPGTAVRQMFQLAPGGPRQSNVAPDDLSIKAGLNRACFSFSLPFMCHITETWRMLRSMRAQISGWKAVGRAMWRCLGLLPPSASVSTIPLVSI